MDFHHFTSIPPEIPTERLLQLHRKIELFRQITENYSVHSSKEISKKERSELSLTKSSYTYGEVDFLSLGETFEIIKAHFGTIPEGGTFYDLGSGSGKGVIAGALIHNFSKCIGIEILKGLYEVSENMKILYEQHRLNVVDEQQDLFMSLPDIEFINDDIFKKDWSDASFIFANSTCFDAKMMEGIASKQVRPGTWAVTLTKHLPSEKWRIMQSFRKSMSWGDATVYIHLAIE